MFGGSDTRQFSNISVIDIDQESFVTFYGCEEYNVHASVGILILIREEKFENFNGYKLELSYELLKLSFGFQLVEDIDDSNNSTKNCEFHKLYNDVV